MLQQVKRPKDFLHVFLFNIFFCIKRCFSHAIFLPPIIFICVCANYDLCDKLKLQNEEKWIKSKHIDFTFVDAAMAPDLADWNSLLEWPCVDCLALVSIHHATLEHSNVMHSLRSKQSPTIGVFCSPKTKNSINLMGRQMQTKCIPFQRYRSVSVLSRCSCKRLCLCYFRRLHE